MVNEAQRSKREREGTRPEALTVCVDTLHVERVQRRHAAAMLREDIERASVVDVRVSDHARNRKGMHRVNREATREARQHGGIDARLLTLASTDERATYCKERFGRTLSSREWRNLSRAVSKNDQRLIVKLSAAFRR